MYEIETTNGFIFCDNWEFLGSNHYELINTSLLIDGIMTTVKSYGIIASEVLSITKLNYKEAYKLTKKNMGDHIWN